MDKEYFKVLYILREELNKANKSKFSSREIAEQAFEDYECSDMPSYMIILFETYIEQLDLNDEFIETLIDGVKRVGENDYYWHLAEKRAFVLNELATLIMSIDSNITDVGFRYKDGDEYVLVLYKNGFERKICVTADSKRAIVSDVIREMH